MAGYAPSYGVPFPSSAQPVYGSPSSRDRDHHPIPMHAGYPGPQYTPQQVPVAFPSRSSPDFSPSPGSPSQPPPVPGTRAYYARPTPDGRVEYTPVVAEATQVRTPQGVMQSVQWVQDSSSKSRSKHRSSRSPTVGPAGMPGMPGMGMPPGPSISGVPPMHGPPQGMSGLAGMPLTTPYPPRPTTAPTTPGFAYDMHRYGDMLYNKGGDRDDGMRDWAKENKQQQKEMERQAKARRKEEKEAAKRMQRWEKEQRERERAEEKERKRAHQDRDRILSRSNSVANFGQYGGRERRISGNVNGAFDRERRPSLGASAAPGPGFDRERRISGRDLHAKLQAMGFGPNDRERAISGGFGGARSRRVSMSEERPTGERSRRVSGVSSYERPSFYPGAGGGAPPGPPRPNYPPAGAYDKGGSMYGDRGYGHPGDRSYPPSPNQVPMAPGSSAGPPGYGPGSEYGRSPAAFRHGNSPQPGPGSAYGGDGYASSRSGVPRGAYSESGAPHPAAYSESGSYSMRGRGSPPSFNREPNRAQAYTPFESFPVVYDLNDMITLLPSLPPLPAVLVPHDVLHDDWGRYMNALIAAWQGKRGDRTSRRGYAVADLIDDWNSSFFLARGVELVLYRGRERITAPGAGGRVDEQLLRHLSSSSLSSSSLSSTSDDSSDDDDEEDGYMSTRRSTRSGRSWAEGSSRKSDRKEKRRQKKRKDKARGRGEEDRYALFATCITSKSMSTANIHSRP
ncbi:hypothetical protein BOTBODRAFT_48603 [Botryobasidium botryosum FD-172 SS1]|uniref:Uncharacterized protein n=1 Tax=Botryobasidium botryosum (strain FD-172 SS1) TaxID=930990 RepID=A0A067LZE4_BOTB1|nr:hypothetical protein BOTBODRAFT_48603 [Botryobasidium botryosum FD-172 SS1]